ncbi:MAG: hypothetical protein IPL92_11865 [Saprospiraceae bacterium]|nr:hypothetical protein [Candidatus Opimibacter iunctus]
MAKKQPFCLLRQFSATGWLPIRRKIFNEAAGLIKKRIVGRWLCLRLRTTGQKKHVPGKIIVAVFNGR